MFIDNDPGSGSMIQDPAAWSRIRQHDPDSWGLPAWLIKLIFTLFTLHYNMTDLSSANTIEENHLW